MTDLISLNSVTIGYNNKIVLRDVDLTVNRGEIITIVGPNGSPLFQQLDLCHALNRYALDMSHKN